MTAQKKRLAAYLRQLSACGFHSWKRANERRGELINRDVRGIATKTELDELAKLQKLCGLYQRWKTNDSLGQAIRRLEKHGGKL